MFNYLIFVVCVWILNAVYEGIFGHILVFPKSNQLNDAVFCFFLYSFDVYSTYPSTIIIEVLNINQLFLKLN